MATYLKLTCDYATIDPKNEMATLLHEDELFTLQEAVYWQIPLERLSYYQTNKRLGFDVTYDVDLTYIEPETDVEWYRKMRLPQVNW